MMLAEADVVAEFVGEGSADAAGYGEGGLM